MESRPLPGKNELVLNVRILPGHQDDLQNNIYLVTFPDGRTVAHCGDQYNREDLPWLKEVSKKLARPLDILIIDCWAMELKETVEGFSRAWSFPATKTKWATPSITGKPSGSRSISLTP